MEPPVTTYESSDGKVTPIAELNNFHLVNALLKVSANMAKGTYGTDSEKIMKPLLDALKAEVFKRMDNRPTQG